jgi:hypothetical protein
VGVGTVVGTVVDVDAVIDVVVETFEGEVCAIAVVVVDDDVEDDLG